MQAHIVLLIVETLLLCIYLYTVTCCNQYDLSDLVIHYIIHSYCIVLILIVSTFSLTYGLWKFNLFTSYTLD